MLISIWPHDLLPALPARDGHEQRADVPPPCFHALDYLIDQCFHVPSRNQHMHLEGSGREMPQFRDKAGVISAPYAGAARSEEHTSELQSLMRNSYAVFCLNKKK